MIPYLKNRQKTTPWLKLPQDATLVTAKVMTPTYCYGNYN